MHLPSISSLLLLLLPLLTLTFASQADQVAMHTENQPTTSNKPTLADLLTIEPSASIFYGYARELEMSSMLSDGRLKLTLFVPTNKAVMALARKPHQGMDDVDDGVEISEEEFDSQSKSNVEHWVSVHVIPEAPISLNSQYETLLRGKSITFTPISKNDGKGPEWSRVTLEDGIRILDKREGLNGVLYLIDSTISPEVDCD
ncbi:hypothetical protein K443DRAFT_683826 [Laccaria amethystina LaAM-08-1]|uniref:FAS1 domain-containing protein n=1 Tax=Laccaria amethystina LaAM-08-1 TaxID=1095629 RepID=A0A0C9X9L0_9AGAR|nr:hypothetical protein K443DRAFT_683826 [Laccaria amethystina LaAM-08-1]